MMNMDIQTADSKGAKKVSNALSDFIFHCQYEKALSKKTIAAYQIDLEQLKDFLYEAYSVEVMESISKDMIKAYLQKISDFKPKTIKRKIASSKAFFSFYEFENDTFINPFRKMKIQMKEPYILPTVMCSNEIKLILEYLYKERMKEANRDSYTYVAKTRDIAIIELLFATGVRVSELCQLQWNDIDLTQGTIKVYGKGSKERIIQICSKGIISIMKEYYKQTQPTTSFFTNRLGHEISPQSVRLLVKRCIKELNLSKHITPHTFRHTFATLLLEEDVDIKYIQSILGHSSIVTTQIYTHVNSNKQKKILRNKHPRNKIEIKI